MRVRIFARLLLVGAALLAAVLALSAEQARPSRLEVNYTQFTLPNGLNVILHEDHTVPFVCVDVWYYVGSAREKPGRTGFAHLFEHIMFEGSKNVKEGGVRQAARGGGRGQQRLDGRRSHGLLAERAVQLPGARALPRIRPHGPSPGRQTGPFFAAAAVQTDKTAPSLSEFFKELEGIRKPIGEEELARARNYVALRYPAGFETTGQLAGKLESKVLFDLPDDFFITYGDRVAKVIPSDVARGTAQYIDPRAVVIIVVGDRKKIEPGIRALNLGPLKILSIDEILGGRSPRSRAQSPK